MKGVSNNYLPQQSPTKQEPQHDWWHLFTPESCQYVDYHLQMECQKYSASQSPQQAPTSQRVKWSSFMPESCALIEDTRLQQECEKYFTGHTPRQAPTQHLLPNNPRHEAHKAHKAQVLTSQHVDGSHFTPKSQVAKIKAHEPILREYIKQYLGGIGVLQEADYDHTQSNEQLAATFDDQLFCEFSRIRFPLHLKTHPGMDVDMWTMRLMREMQKVGKPPFYPTCSLFETCLRLFRHWESRGPISGERFQHTSLLCALSEVPWVCGEGF